MAFALGAGLVGQPAEAAWSPPRARYGMASERADVRMSDGVALNATITRPTDPKTGRPAAGRFPVILVLTPYAKDEPGLAGVNVTPAEDFVPYGYINVVVDVRGTGSSGGSFELLGPREAKDSVELVDWAARLRGSTGRVGLTGESYLALAQMIAAGAVGRGSPLKAIFPIDGGVDMYRDLAVPGGMFNNLFDTPYAGLELGMDTAGPLTSGQSLPQSAQNASLHIEGNAETDGRTLADAFSGGDRAYDQGFWRARSIADALARVPANGVAVLAYNSWFDIWQRGDPLVYSILQNAQAGRPPLAMTARSAASADPRFQVVLGPYVHAQSGNLLRKQLGALALEWFETWLKGADTGILDTRRPLHAYELLGKRWTDLAAWPPRSARPRTWYLAAGPTSTGAPSLNDGALKGTTDTSAGADAIAWNGNMNSPCTRQTYQQSNAIDFITPSFESPCFYDDRTFEAGGLTYTSDPFKRALDIAGPGNVTIYATANTTNTEWVVTLSDVSPDGTARPLSTGDLIGSARALTEDRGWRLRGKTIMPWHPFTRASEMPVAPGRLTRYDIELPAVLGRIAAGHRLRLTVQTSDAPYLVATFPHQSQLFGGRYQVHRGTAAPSGMTLPVVAPARLARAARVWGPCVTDC